MRATTGSAWCVPLDDAGPDAHADPEAADPDTPTRTPSRLRPAGSVKLTGRGAVLALFVSSLFGLLVAGWTGWSAFADAIFVMSCGVVA